MQASAAYMAGQCDIKGQCGAPGGEVRRNVRSWPLGSAVEAAVWVIFSKGLADAASVCDRVISGKS